MTPGWIDPPNVKPHRHDLPQARAEDMGRRYRCSCGGVFKVTMTRTGSGLPANLQDDEYCWDLVPTKHEHEHKMPPPDVLLPVGMIVMCHADCDMRFQLTQDQRGEKFWREVR